MTWINFVPFDQATGRLKTSYDKYKRANDTIANIYSAHSLRPHTLEGHVAFFRSVIGHSANTLPLWYLEAIGVYVSVLNQCGYCIDHHAHFGAEAFDGDAERWDTIVTALKGDKPETVFDGKMLAFFSYTKKLTLNPSSLAREDIEALQASGADDGEVLEVNQVAGYFAYANRTVLGLGVDLVGEVYAG